MFSLNGHWAGYCRWIPTESLLSCPAIGGARTSGGPDGGELAIAASTEAVRLFTEREPIFDLLKPPDPRGSYGPFTYDLSAHSNVLREFAGGDGHVAIHGTNPRPARTRLRSTTRPRVTMKTPSAGAPR